MGETCATCTHFIGSGDWGLCCDLKYDLCYSCTPNLQRKCRTTLTGVLQTSNVRMDTKKGFLQRRAFFTISINGKEVQKSE